MICQVQIVIIQIMKIDLIIIAVGVVVGVVVDVVVEISIDVVVDLIIITSFHFFHSSFKVKY